MSIEPVFRKLITMMEEAGAFVKTNDIDYSDYAEATNVNPMIVCEVFERFAYMKFDCSYLDEIEDEIEKFRCLDWEDQCILFECGTPRFEDDVFSFSFKRAFGITFGSIDIDIKDQSEVDKDATTYSELITCRMLFEPNDELRALRANNISTPPYEVEQANLFRNLAPYRTVIEKYKPQTLVLTNYGD